MNSKPPVLPRKAHEKYTLEEAMARTGAATPKAALAAMNQGRRGRNRFTLSPMAANSPGRSREAARRLKQAARAAEKRCSL